MGDKSAIFSSLSTLRNGGRHTYLNDDWRLTYLNATINEYCVIFIGLFFAPYPHWKTLRTVSLHSLRDDGMGRAALEPKIAEEIEEYIKHFIKPTMIVLLI